MKQWHQNECMTVHSAVTVIVNDLAMYRLCPSPTAAPVTK